MTVTNKIITVPSSNVRNINAVVTATPSDPYGSYTAGISDSVNRLVDGYLNTVLGTSTDIAEYFDDEWYRLLSNFNIESIIYNSGEAGGWDSAISLVSGTAGYDGLQVIDGTIQYPISNYTSGYLPSNSQADYSTASGNRVYIRYFYVGTGKQNFIFTVTGTSTTFVSVATGPSLNNLTFEILAPATTKDGSSNTEWKDCYISYTSEDAIGCYTTGTRTSSTVNWGTTLGTKSTATSGSVICVRITASGSWTGTLSTLSVV